MRYVHLIIILFLLSACHISKLGLKNEAVNENLPKDSIVFITMKISFDSLESKNNIEVLSIIKKPGTLKGRFTENIESENYLSCIAFSEINISRDSFSIKHPLYKEFETLDDKNRLSKTSVELKESEFFVRFEKKNYNALVIKESSLLTKDRELIIIKF